MADAALSCLIEERRMKLKLAVQLPLRIVLVPAAVVLLLARPAWAQDQDTQGSQADAQAQAYHFAVRADYLGEHFSLAEGLHEGNSFSSVVYHGRPGGGVDAEYLFVPTFGFAVAASQTTIAAKEVTTFAAGPPVERKGNIGVRPITLALNEHPFQWKHVDFYIGVFAGAVEYIGGSFRADSTQFGFGPQVGLDFPVGDSGFAFNAVGKILSARFPSQFSSGGHFHDQYLYGAGMSYRW
jgi:hypothetical protein